MSDRDPLDDFLKKKLADRQYAFKESYWEAAEQLIEADRGKKKRKGFLIWWMGGLGTLVILLLGIGVWSWFSSRHIEPIASKESLETVSKQSFPIVVLDSCPPEPVFVQSPSSSSSDLGIPAHHSPSKHSTLATAHSSTIKISGDLKNDPDIPIHDSQDSSLIIEQLDDIVTEEQSLPIGQLLKPKDIAEMSHGDVYRLHARSFSLKHSIQSSFHKPAVSIHRKVNLVGIRIALDAAQGLSNDSARKGNSFLPYIALDYARVLHPRFKLHTGIGYVQRGQLQSDQYYRSTNYGFGFETVLTTISPQKLHFLEVPLYGEWKIKARHSLMMGGSLLQLMNVSSQISSRTQDDFGISNGQAESTWGYKQGFISRDVSLMVGYKYYLGSGFHLDLRSQYGLRDLTEQSFFENQSFDRNIRVQIGLSYDFLNF